MQSSAQRRLIFVGLTITSRFSCSHVFHANIRFCTVNPMLSKADFRKRFQKAKKIVKKILELGDVPPLLGDVPPLFYWGMFHLCSKIGQKNSDRMTTFLQDRMVKKNHFFRFSMLNLEV
jgi:hypothetical protein